MVATMNLRRYASVPRDWQVGIMWMCPMLFLFVFDLMFLCCRTAWLVDS